MISNSISRETKKMEQVIDDIIYKNPYDKKKMYVEYKMWREQCKLNFPILYYSSIYLYEYGKKRSCNNYLFATRDCSQWYKIFKKLYPNVSSTYFHCSRNMFETATDSHNEHYIEYVKGLVDGKIDKTVFIDIHGTGKRVFTFFEKEFGQVPYCFLLSATFPGIKYFPKMSREYYKKKKLYCAIFDTRGSPIEMLNYDIVGTLQGYTNKGPIRDKLEYDFEKVKIYHNCFDMLTSKIGKQKDNLCKEQIHKIKREMKKYFNILKHKKVMFTTFTRHIGKHKKNTNLVEKYISQNIEKEEEEDSHYLILNDIISKNTVYGIIWDGTIQDKSCIVKMVKLDSGITDSDNDIFSQCDNEPYNHTMFKNKKAMSIDYFNNEVKQLENLANLNMAPKLYKSWVCNKYDVHYGFIVMEKYDCSLKDIIIKRNLTLNERDSVNKMINKLHNMEYIHGDLKPSNMGVKLSHKSIANVCFLDCSKVKNIGDLSKHEQKKLIEKDKIFFERHEQQNLNIRSKNNKSRH